MKPGLSLLALAAALLWGPLAIAQVALPVPNARGDYTTNDGPVRGPVASHRLQGGTLWRVVAARAEGRAAPGSRGKIVGTFPRGTVLQADVGRGGSDEVLTNPLDDAGRPWMRVRSANGDALGCYVRANAAVIRPLRTGEGTP